jgi:ubiquitin C-terminal hydrolase
MVPMFSGLFRTKLTYLDSGAVSSNFAPFTVLPLTLPKKDELSLQDCLDELTHEEELDKDNMVSGKLSYGKYLGKKQETIWKLPKYMTIQLKRFKYNDYGQVSMKDTRKVSYPLEIDMSKYIDKSSKYNGEGNNYKLYGVTLHHGMMMGGFSSGHYISLVKNRSNGKWYLYNDDKTPCELRDDIVVNNNAYILYYVRDD